ncbi:Transmembrane protein, TqsA-like [Desulfonema limicola]|uniref:Transmembrane protein, TqsA-like n=1 Tax=Desulfonema limicola TaxID=45656 RepID=A0A975B3T0_9BACT|nr:AI-2E family transporter [Desulfonema limicola]QTA78258.1 Transmembrane protein, TqsA-like [Desulfonema limicola]
MINVFRIWLKKYFSDPQVVILGFLILLGFVMIFTLGNMLAPVIVSIIAAYLLEGMVAILEKFKLPRMAAVLVVFILFMACLLVLIIWLLPMLSRQIGQLVQDFPAMIANGQKELMLLPEKYPDFISRDQIRQIIDYLTTEFTRMGQYIISISLASVKGIITFLVYIILVPLMIFFFLKDKVLILEWCKGFLPDERKLATDVWYEVNHQIGNYVRGKIWEILIVWAVSYLTFILLKLPFAMLLSLFVGLSVLIPYLGATIMFLPVGLIAFLEWGWGAPLAYTMIALGIIQALDGNLLVPLLLSGVVNLHPIAIIVAVLVFGGLWGMLGLFFAIPLATFFHAVIKAWQSTSRDEKPGELLSETWSD